MKKLLYFIFCLPLMSSAQNWTSVPMGQHNIYRVNVSGMDSIWNGYVRNIYVDNVLVGVNGDQFNFYRSLRRDHNEVLDSINGPTWLGRFVYRGNNGDEIFLNKYLDTIRIKTWAQLNDSWTLAYDTNGTKRFEGTITSSDTLTIDGVVDSIKKINIQAFNGLSPIPSTYNSYEIILSKEHGFYQILDFYGFPNSENAILNSNPLLSTANVFPILPYPHLRLDSAVTYRNYGKTDLLWQYQPGNNWIIQSNGPGSLMPVYTYDSIQSVVVINLDTVIATFKRDILTWQNTAPPPFLNYTRTFQTSVLTDTISKVEYISSLVQDSLENKFSYPTNSYYCNWTFIDFYCNDKIVYRDSGYYYVDLGGDGWNNSYFLEDFNMNGFNSLLRHSPGGFHNERRPIYANINGCTYGTYFPLRPQGINNYYSSNSNFKVYPNPTSNKFYIQPNEYWEEVEIINLQGETIKTFQQQQRNEMSIAELPRSLYLIKVKSAEGNYFLKLFKK